MKDAGPKFNLLTEVQQASVMRGPLQSQFNMFPSWQLRQSLSRSYPAVAGSHTEVVDFHYKHLVKIDA